ncbi:MAG TPA: hypothetical protein PLI12_05095, partial [Acetobacteraceae bacterium]|nr:hypothetical protein [Acetobacteraceae bacterium]
LLIFIGRLNLVNLPALKQGEMIRAGWRGKRIGGGGEHEIYRERHNLFFICSHFYPSESS